MSGLLPSVVPAMAWALLDFVWQGLLVGWGAALLLALLRKARPQLRYAVACAALLLCAALPVAGTVQRVLDDAGTAMSLHLLAHQHDAPAGKAGAAPVIAVAADRVASWERTLQDQLPLVLLFWACGAGVLALRMSLGLAWVRRQSRPGACGADAAWQARLDHLAARMGIARRVALGVVDELLSPVTAGCWRPVVLVPASLLTGMPPDLLEALLAHELAHVRRFDYLVNLLQGAIEILLFYHPTVWWLSNRIRIEREQVADDLAASTLGEPRRLALALSELDLFQLTTPQLAPAAQGGNLMSRIKRLVRPESEPLNWKMAVPILGLAVFAAFATQSAVAEQARPEPAPVAAPAPATNAEPGKPKQLAHNRRVRRDDAFALVRETGHGTNMSGDSADWDDIDEAKRSVSGDFLWFREGGKTWMVQDPAVLAKAGAAWANVDKLGQQMDGLGRQMDGHGKKMEALGRQMALAGAGFHPDEKQLRQLEGDMQKLSGQMEKLGEQMEDASGPERKRIEREMHELGRKMHTLGAEMNRQANSGAQQQARAEMDAIGRSMHEAGKPMNELGKQMKARGKQMEQESRQAEKTTRDLIRDARERGLARELPSRG